MYGDVEELVAGMEEQGLPCNGLRILDAPQSSIQDFGLCFLSTDKEFETDIYVFAGASARDAWHAAFADSPSVHVLLGQNWLITSGSPQELAEIQGAIGGDIDPGR